MLVIRKAAFLVFGMFILISPLFPQVLKIGGPWVRQWTMYSGVGMGLLKGDFIVEYKDGRQDKLTALNILGLERYPDRFHYTFDNYVTSPETLQAFGQQYCEANPSVRSLTFDGRVGVASGWAAYATSNMCTIEVASNG